MDSLDRVLAPGQELLGRVDVTLCEYGAPSGHPVVPLIRRLGMLPGAALDCFAGLDATAAGALTTGLRALADQYASHRAAVDTAVGPGWHGAVADGFTQSWQALGNHLGDGAGPDEPSLAGRVLGLLGYMDDVATWMLVARAGIGVAVARAMGSAAAVNLRLAPQPLAVGATMSLADAAATIGVGVLSAAEAAVIAGHEVRRRWASRLDTLPYAGPDGDVPRPAGGFGLGLP